jgi:hypothetical protein
MHTCLAAGHNKFVHFLRVRDVPCAAIMRWYHVLTLHPAVLHGGAQGAAGQSFWARKLQEKDARSAAILFEGEPVVTLPLDGLIVGDFAAALVFYSLSNMLVALGDPLLANQLTILACSDFVLKRPANRSTFAPTIDLCAPTVVFPGGLSPSRKYDSALAGIAATLK